MLASTVGDKVIEVATTLLGLVETKANAAWDNPATAGEDQASKDLEQMLKDVGWRAGYAYCAGLVEAVWRQAHQDLQAPPELQARIKTNLTLSVMQSYNNVRRLGQIETEPKPGAIFFMQMGTTPNGHAGIVVKSESLKLATIEGNTSPLAGTPEADREGDGIFRKIRTLTFEKKERGLWLRGFWNVRGW